MESITSPHPDSPGITCDSGVFLVLAPWYGNTGPAGRVSVSEARSDGPINPSGVRIMFASRRSLIGLCLVAIAAIAIGGVTPAAQADGYRLRSHRSYHSSYSQRYRPVYRPYRSRYSASCRTSSYRPYYRSSRWNFRNANHYRYRGSYYYGSHRTGRLHR